jgi:tRNA(fMet)-specific endonuclease VapC
MFLPDTNAFIRVLNKRSAKLVTRFMECDPKEIALSAIVKSELVFGALNSERVEANLETLEQFLKPHPVIEYTASCANAYGQLRAHLRRAGTPIGPLDMLIAATALTHDLTLVTHNTREFSRIPELKLEDWEV